MESIDEQAQMMRLIKETEQKAEEANYKNNINNGYILISGVRREIVDLNIENKISIKIPNDFEVLSKEITEIKYPNINRPDIIYSNEFKTVDISFSFEDDGNLDEEIPKVKDETVKLFKKIYPASKIIDNETIDLKGNNLSYFSIDVPLIDTKICNLLFITKVNSETLVGNFNCRLTEYDDWKFIVRQILESINIIEV